MKINWREQEHDVIDVEPVLTGCSFCKTREKCHHKAADRYICGNCITRMSLDHSVEELEDKPETFLPVVTDATTVDVNSIAKKQEIINMQIVKLATGWMLNEENGTHVFTSKKKLLSKIDELMKEEK